MEDQGLWALAWAVVAAVVLVAVMSVQMAVADMLEEGLAMVDMEEVD